MHTSEAALSSIPLFRWIWRSYLRTALVPLLLVELSFLVAYFVSNIIVRERNIEVIRHTADDELVRIAQQESLAIHNLLSGVTQATDVYRRQTARALATPATPAAAAKEKQRNTLNPEGVYYTIQDDGGSAVFYSGVKPIGPKEKDKVARSAALDSLMRDIKETNPLVVQIYFNTFDSLNRIYPYFEVLSQYAPKMDIPSYNFYYEADLAHNPSRRVVWTDAYVDPAGQGWMASAIAPVYEGDRLEAVVGLDVTVETITRKVLDLNIPWEGYGLLVGKDGVILALPSRGERDWGLNELTNHAYTDYIRENVFKPDQFNLYKRPEVAGLAKEVAERASGLLPVTLGGRTMLASWDTIPDTGWRLLVMAPEMNIYASANGLAHWLSQIGVGMVALLLSFYLVFFAVLYRRARAMSRSISQPLVEMDAMVQRIGQGEYRQSVPHYGIQELQTTASELVHMGQTLGESSENLRRAMAELAQARDQAMESLRLKSEFLSIVSHELRTPMNGIMGMNELLMATPLTQEQRDYSQLVQDSAQQLLHIINDILDLSRMEQGRLHLENRIFPVRLTIQAVVAVMAPRAADKQLALSIQIDPAIPEEAKGDPDRLGQVLLNLLSNGVKFTDHGSVTLAVTVEEQTQAGVQVRFAITDTGIGIEETARKRLFQPFVQADGSYTRRHGGTGLGLAIAKQVVELMGGQIGLESKAGQGSTFWFSVPLERMESSVTSVSRQPSAPIAPPVTALLVEDNLFNQKVVMTQLTKLGYRYRVAVNGQEGLTLAITHPFDVILMDCQMPVMDGLEASRAIRVHEEANALPRVPIIALTANAMEADRERCLAAGMDDYLAKPVKLDALRGVLEWWVGPLIDPNTPPENSRGPG